MSITTQPLPIAQCHRWMDPNFPSGLNISPNLTDGDYDDTKNQADAIQEFGIAGRIW